MENAKVAVVIPCYKVKAQVLDVIGGIGPEVTRIYAIDDKCPEESGMYIQQHCRDTRVSIIFHPENTGVGGATISGYKKALADDMDIVIKIDGDGQMDPSLIRNFVAPIAREEADYVKGNRFFNPEDVREMPSIRLFGNAVLSFMSKLSTGYWELFDPTNGYTAIHAEIIKLVPWQKVSNRYFFETDLLFRLNILGCVVQDIPMAAHYGNENSSLNIGHSLFTFLKGHTRNFFKRILYNHYLRGFSIASIELAGGLVLTAWGVGYGIYKWWQLGLVNQFASAGTVMLCALPVIIGTQLILSALNYDIQNTPSIPIHPTLKRHG